LEQKEHTLKDDKDLINRILGDMDSRYIILFLFIIRKDLFKDLSDFKLIISYNRVINLEEIFKGNLKSYWNEEFIKIAIDLGLFKNIRSYEDFNLKDDDFIIKMGVETITIEENIEKETGKVKYIISVPADTLFLMINKKFKSLTKRNFNLALIRLKGVRCENTGAIHPFIYKIGEKDYTLSDDLYEFLKDDYANIYLAIKGEFTIDGFYKKFKETQDKILNYIEIFDIFLKKKEIIKKINNVIEENNLELTFSKDEDSKDKAEKLDFLDITIKLKVLDAKIKFKLSNSNYQKLLDYRTQLQNINDQLIEMRTYYSTKEKKYSYLEFIEQISEEKMEIQKKLIDLRNEISKLKPTLKLIESDIKEVKV